MRWMCWAGLSVSLAGCSLDRDTFHCERAIAHLNTCCDDLQADRICGDGVLTDNQVSLHDDEVECILTTPCNKAQPVCEAVEVLQLELEDSWGSTGRLDTGNAEELEAVCL